MNNLITKSLEEDNIQLLSVFPRELVSGSELKWLEWIGDYTMRYGKPPTVKRLVHEHPSFIPVTSPDPLGDIYDQTLVKKRNIYTREFILGIESELKKGIDPQPYIQQLNQVLAGGAANVTRYTTFDRTAYFRTPTSFPYGIKQIDQHTGGISAGDLIYIIGRLGTGKTSFALWVVSQWLRAERRVLVVSNENRADDVIAKIDSYIGGFNPLKKRTMEWTDQDRQCLDTVSFIAKNMSGEVFVPQQPVRDVKEVQSLVQTYRPDIVLVDGIYLMQGASGDSYWEKITSVSRSLKQLAEGEGLPVMGIHQANRNAIGKRIEVEHIAYADALAQDADLVLGINKEEDKSILVEAIKSRWGQQGWGFFLRFFFDTMTVRVMDAATAVEEDEE